MTSTALYGRRSIDLNHDHLISVTQAVIGDMRDGTCFNTIIQNVQVIELGDGKRVLVQLKITTDTNEFL
jgi:hypothetical protein